MRTNVVIDDGLMSRALKSGGYRTKKSAIESGLRLIVQLKQKGMVTYVPELYDQVMDTLTITVKVPKAKGKKVEEQPVEVAHE